MNFGYRMMVLRHFDHYNIIIYNVIIDYYTCIYTEMYINIIRFVLNSNSCNNNYCTNIIICTFTTCSIPTICRSAIKRDQSKRAPPSSGQLGGACQGWQPCQLQLRPGAEGPLGQADKGWSGEHNLVLLILLLILNSCSVYIFGP